MIYTVIHLFFLSLAKNRDPQNLLEFQTYNVGFIADNPVFCFVFC